MAIPGKKWVATEAVCKTCRGPEYESAYDCLYYRIGSKKKYSDKNEVIVYQYCFLPPHNEEKSSLNEIKASDRCGPDCDKKGYKKRPLVPGIEETTRNRKLEDEASSQKRSFWKSAASIFADQKSPESPRVNQDIAPSRPVVPGVGPKTVRKGPPAQEPRLSAGREGEIEKEKEKQKQKQIEGLLNKAKEQANYGEYEKAIESFEKVLTLDSQNAKAREGIKKAAADRVMKPYLGGF
jgi:hypothetical protein